MQAQGMGSPEEQDNGIDSAVMEILLGDYRGLLKIVDIQREIGDSVAVQDSIARLYGAGLIHRLDDFVFPTKAAVAGWRALGG
jgi:hypothetical protein